MTRVRVPKVGRYNLSSKCHDLIGCFGGGTSVTGLDLSTPPRHQVKERKRFMPKEATKNNKKSAHKVFE
ncbi:hypothetical protein Gotri_016196 [Gossypium trilobum]|uniref:Uncharacterized protein n=1 Tax=Gossypium trilobum TaxID=34281 RepID=A0A7J9E2P8_9ROSI|nr:hypothetical protein [Gossypium trilobum]